jgi:hypothetical protein
MYFASPLPLSLPLLLPSPLFLKFTSPGLQPWEQIRAKRVPLCRRQPLPSLLIFLPTRDLQLPTAPGELALPFKNQNSKIEND